ncbi:hypothetical protein [Cognatiyoonia sp.]|uniref:hypothetical protein n=1 Tax=Cognatiyoonia sp. TaxID=2211652 RepID=UPI003F6A27E5
MNGLSDEGGRSLGGASQSKLIAGACQNIVDQNAALKRELEVIRNDRDESQKNLARIEGRQRGSVVAKVLGGLVVVIGPAQRYAAKDHYWSLLGTQVHLLTLYSTQAFIPYMLEFTRKTTNQTETLRFHL